MGMTKLDVLATVIIGAHTENKAAVGSITWAKAIAEALAPHGLSMEFDQGPGFKPQRVALQLDVSTALAEAQVKEIASLVAKARFLEEVIRPIREEFESMAIDSGYSDSDLKRDESGAYAIPRLQAIWSNHLTNSEFSCNGMPDFIDHSEPGAF